MNDKIQDESVAYFHYFNEFEQVEKKTSMNSLERVWARATGHVMGNTDDDRPDIPILTLNEARVVLFLKTFWVIMHTIACFALIANVIHHW
jgi:hypothetical protein